jgi:endonuclease YncB( thermonuclease family)
MISVQNRDRSETSDRPWAIRLVGVDCPEDHTMEGEQATGERNELLEDADLSVWIPPPKKIRNLFGNLTFDRIPGFVWLGTQYTLNEAMIRRGYGR